MSKRKSSNGLNFSKRVPVTKELEADDIARSSFSCLAAKINVGRSKISRNVNENNKKPKDYEECSENNKTVDGEEGTSSTLHEPSDSLPTIRKRLGCQDHKELIKELKIKYPTPPLKNSTKKLHVESDDIQSVDGQKAYIRKKFKLAIRDADLAMPFARRFELIKRYEFSNPPPSIDILGSTFSKPATIIERLLTDQKAFLAVYDAQCKLNKKSGEAAAATELDHIDQLIVLHAYDYKHPQPSIASLAAQYNVSSECITRLIRTNASRVASRNNRQQRAEYNRRQEQIKLLGMVMYEYLQRAVHCNVWLDESLFLTKAADVIDYIGLSSFRPSYLWLFVFKKLYGIDEFNVKSLKTTIPMANDKPSSLNEDDLVEFVMLRNSDVFQTDVAERQTYITTASCESNMDEDIYTIATGATTTDLEPSYLSASKIEISETQFTAYNGVQPIKEENKQEESSFDRTVLTLDNKSCQESDPTNSEIVVDNVMKTIYFKSDIEEDEASTMPEEDQMDTIVDEVVTIKTEPNVLEEDGAQSISCEALTIKNEPQDDYMQLNPVKTDIQPDITDLELEMHPLDCMEIKTESQALENYQGEAGTSGNAIEIKSEVITRENDEREMSSPPAAKESFEGIIFSQCSETIKKENDIQCNRQIPSSNLCIDEKTCLKDECSVDDIETPEDARKQLEMLQIYAATTENFRAMIVLSQLEEAFKEDPSENS